MLSASSSLISTNSPFQILWMRRWGMGSDAADTIKPRHKSHMHRLLTGAWQDSKGARDGNNCSELLDRTIGRGADKAIDWGVVIPSGIWTKVVATPTSLSQDDHDTCGDTSGTDTIAGAGGISPKKSAGQRGERMSGWKGYDYQDCIGNRGTPKLAQLDCLQHPRV